MAPSAKKSKIGLSATEWRSAVEKLQGTTRAG